MAKPILNINIRDISTRDSLGVENVATKCQREICPIINTVTHRPFYWAFFVWNLYEFHKDDEITDKTNKNFYGPFLKRNDYFFVMANLLTQNSDRDNMPGQTRVTENLSKDDNGPYMYDEGYYKVRTGGMQYYDAGCYSMNLITTKNNKGEEIKKAYVPYYNSEFGEEVALAFRSVIESTKYYKDGYYKRINDAVPKDVLKELGSVLTINVRKNENIKNVLNKVLFDSEYKNYDKNNIIITRDLSRYIYHEEKMSELPKSNELRRILYDVYSPKVIGHKIPDEKYKSELAKWEFTIGRQYFAISLGLIWKYLLKQIATPKTLKDWINEAISDSYYANKGIIVEKELEVCNFSFEEREKMIALGSGNSSNIKENLKTGMQVILSVYNRLKDRNDIPKDFYCYGDNISINSLITLVDNYKKESVSSLLYYIIENWIIKQHSSVAFRKMEYGINGHYFIYNDGKYYFQHDHVPEFQAIRMYNVMQIMDDLGELK